MAIRKPFFVVPLDLGTMVAGNEQTGFPVTNLNRPQANGLVWKSIDGSGSHFIRGDFGSAKAVDFVGLINTTATPGVTHFRVRVGDSAADVNNVGSYDSGVVEFVDPFITRDDGLYHSHVEFPATQTRRWWRIDIGNHGPPLQASHLVIGKKIELSRFYDYGFQYGVKDLGGLEISRWGVFDEEPGVVLRTLDFSLGWLTEAEYESSIRPMVEKLGGRGIVYLCFDPEPTTYRQARTYMGVLQKPAYARGNRKPKTYSMDFSLLSMI